MFFEVVNKTKIGVFFMKILFQFTKNVTLSVFNVIFLKQFLSENSFYTIFLCSHTHTHTHTHKYIYTHTNMYVYIHLFKNINIISLYLDR